MGGTTSLNSRKNSKNRLSTTKCSKSNGICWVRCFSLDDDSHNSASFLSSPISTSVPKFNDNKPGNLYNSNYGVLSPYSLFYLFGRRVFIIILFQLLVSQFSFKLTCLFHQESPNCLSASVANSRSTTSNSTKRKFNWYKYTANTTINVECKKCFYIFPRDDFMLLSIFNCCNYFRFY